MNKFQNVNFRSVGDFLDFLPEDELRIVEVLRKLVLDSIPDCKEKLSFNVPYYSRHANICFIWPSSIPWGAVEQGVSLGFAKGNLLSAQHNYLESKGRKSIRSKNFNSIQEINTDLIRGLIYEAVEVDSEQRKK